jgi:hypothetical protein
MYIDTRYYWLVCFDGCGLLVGIKVAVVHWSVVSWLWLNGRSVLMAVTHWSVCFDGCGSLVGIEVAVAHW